MSLIALALLGADAHAGQPSLQLSSGWFQTDAEAFENPTLTVLPRAGYFFTERVGVEAGMGIMFGDTVFEDEVVYRNLTPRAELMVVPFSRGRVDVMVGAGGGVALYSFDGSILEDDDTIVDYTGTTDRDPLASVGPSVRVGLTDSLSLRADLRYMPTFLEDVVDSNFEMTAGLEFRPGPRDRDADGLVDRDDACPLDPEDFDGFEDADGCPELDNDRDGISDAQDACPMNPEDADGFEDADGCPDPDNDSDTVADVADDCPNEFGAVEAAGCPVEAEPLHIDDRIPFDTDTASLKRATKSQLARIADLLKKHPEIERVEIAGHADDRGSKGYNVSLSRRRANAVVSYLVSQGIDADRLTVRAYGEDSPRSSTTTDAGRAENRRVEFRILEQTTSSRSTATPNNEG